MNTQIQIISSQLGYIYFRLRYFQSCMSLILASLLYSSQTCGVCYVTHYRTKVALDAKELIAVWSIIDITWASKSICKHFTVHKVLLE